MSSCTRLFVAFACVFVVALTVENREIEDYISETLLTRNVNETEDAIAGSLRDIPFVSSDRFLLFLNGTDFFASLDDSEFINVSHLLSNFTDVEHESRNDVFYGKADGVGFTLAENGTEYKLYDLDTNEFEVIHTPNTGFELSLEQNGTHVEEAKLFIQKVNNVYSRLPF